MRKGSDALVLVPVKGHDEVRRSPPDERGIIPQAVPAAAAQMEAIGGWCCPEEATRESLGSVLQSESDSFDHQVCTESLCDERKEEVDYGGRKARSIQWQFTYEEYLEIAEGLKRMPRRSSRHPGGLRTANRSRERDLPAADIALPRTRASLPVFERRSRELSDSPRSYPPQQSDILDRRLDRSPLPSPKRPPPGHSDDGLEDILAGHPNIPWVDSPVCSATESPPLPSPKRPTPPEHSNDGLEDIIADHPNVPWVDSPGGSTESADS